MSAIGNFLWFVMGGIITGLIWWIYGTIAFVSIIGIPWGRACFMLGNLAFFPFGREVISRKTLNGRDDIGTGALGTVGNIIWFVVAGVWIAFAHVLCGVVNACTIIGIPFAIQHFKLAGAALFPVGKTVVDKHLAAAVNKTNAEETLSRMRKNS